MNSDEMGRFLSHSKAALVVVLIKHSQARN
jgi:hypothetical protein